MPIDPTLVVLAAGMGSRFGGDKQFTALGPHDETLMDYAVFDAVRAGISRVVLIVRPDSLGVVPGLRTRFGEAVEVLAVEQRLDDLPAGYLAPGGRTRPWGTAQAIWATRTIVSGPFVVVNGDDFYGALPYRSLVEARHRGADEWHLAGYGIRDTLSPSGPVNRAVCSVDDAGYLTGLEEVRGIAARADGSLGAEAAGATRSIPSDAVVSMNMWGLTSDIFAIIEAGFSRFLDRADLMRDEYYLPEAIAEAMTAGRRVRVIPARSKWCGVTFPEDAAAVRTQLTALAAGGAYPSPLWP